MFIDTSMTSLVSTHRPEPRWVNQNGSVIRYSAGAMAGSWTAPESSGQGCWVYGPPSSVWASPWPYQWPDAATR